MAAINSFTAYEGRQGDAFGLTIFGNEVLHWVPVTKDLSAIQHATPFLRPRKLPSWFGGTQIGKALTACRKELMTREEGDRMIILVSDGMSADLYGGRDREIAQQLRDANIVVYVISVQTGSVATAMYTITGTTGGEVFQATDPAALERIFRHIDSMQLAKHKRSATSQMDYFLPVAIAGLVLVGLHVLGLFGLRYTPW
jgi:Ca-activated chloride channel family protein